MTRRHFIGLLTLLGCNEEDFLVKHSGVRASRLFSVFSGSSASVYGYVPIVLKLGQSNEIGFAEATRLNAESSYSSKPTGVKVFLQPNFNTANGGWIDYISGDNIGSGPILGKLLHDNLNTDIFIMEAARPGSGLDSAAGTDTWSPTGNCWVNLRDKVWAEGKAKITNPNGLPLKVVAIHWHQGETDIANSTWTSNYASNFATLMTAVRGLDSLLATAPLFVWKINWATAGNANQTTINNALSAYCADSNNNAYFMDAYTTSSYAWKQDIPSGERTTYPPTLHADDNHASWYTQVNKGLMSYAQLQTLGVVGTTKLATTFTYDQALMDVIGYCSRQSVTLPTSNNLTALNTLITTLKASGVWKKLRIFCTGANDASQTFGFINLKCPDFVAPIFNSTTWTSKQGHKSNGTSQYFYYLAVTGATSPFGISAWEANANQNICIGEFLHAMTSKIAFGIRKTGTANDFYFSGTAGGATGARAFGGTTASPSFTTSNKFFAISRGYTIYPNVSPSWDYYVDSTLTTTTDTRTGSTTDNMQFCRDGAAIGDETVAAHWYGEAMNQTEMDSLRTALVTYKAAI